VQSQNDRSQHKHIAAEMKLLQSRRYEYEMENKQAALDGVEKSEIGWGHQIRSYVMQPYQQVKDTRSNQAFTNVDAILDGDIDKLLEGVLIAQAK
jgi:peptide chain release factor 2